jgi:hypothetical protein
VHFKSLFTRKCARTNEFGVGGLPDFDQAKAAPTVITQARIIAESWNFEAVKFTGIPDGPAFLCLNLQVVYEQFDHVYLTPL